MLPIRPIFVFVAGLSWGSALGYGMARRFLDSRPAISPAYVPQHVRRAPTHPAQHRPVLYDQDLDNYDRVFGR